LEVLYKSRLIVVQDEQTKEVTGSMTSPAINAYNSQARLR
jgi:hypothetical protein